MNKGKPSQAQVDELLDELVIPFYNVFRDMHLPGTDRRENDAEHSWSLSLLACSLAPHIDTTLNIGLVCQFAIVHDLVEVYADDVSVWADDAVLASKQLKEAAALEKIAEKFKHFPWLVETLQKYESQDTNESRYVRAIDKYIAVCIRFKDGGEFYRSEKITKEFFDKNMEIHRKKAQGHPGAAEYYERIRAEYDKHPEHFYQGKLSV